PILLSTHLHSSGHVHHHFPFFLFSTLPRPPRSTLFPYTTLFRSRSAPAERRCAATGTTVPHRRSRLPPRATDRTLSFVSTPPPRFVVLVVLKSGGGIARPPFRLVHDAPTLRDLRRIVRHAHLIVKQLAARVPQELLQLRRSLEQSARAVQRLNTLGQRAQHGEQALGAVRSVHLFRVIAHVPAFPDVSTAPPTPPSMIIPPPTAVLGLCVMQSALLHCGAD